MKVLCYDSFDRKLDAFELNQLGELDALFRGLNTWAFYGEYTYRRNAQFIRDSPKAFGAKLYRDHRCDIPSPTLFALAPPPKIILDGDDPPF